jgi:hypothetical protein
MVSYKENNAMNLKYLIPATLLLASGLAAGPASQPASRSAPLPADTLLHQMLRPDQAAARDLKPSSDSDVRDVTSGRGANAPNAPTVPLLREGTFIVDRTGRLSHSGENGASEFVFDSDGRTLRDPPLIILPNSKLMQMEDAAKSANRDFRFRITGIVTEYRGRNAILIEKVVVVPDVVQLQGN